jgi:hypothetical protein
MSRLLALICLAACGTVATAELNAPALGATASVTLESTGGIASLRILVRIDSVNRTLQRDVCPLAVSSAECGSRGRRETVRLAAIDVAHLFGLTATAEFRALRPDYGRSTQGADLMDHLVVVTANGRVQRVRADDITRPTPVAELMTEIGTLATAR